MRRRRHARRTPPRRVGLTDRSTRQLRRFGRFFASVLTFGSVVADTESNMTCLNPWMSRISVGLTTLVIAGSMAGCGGLAESGDPSSAGSYGAPVTAAPALDDPDGCLAATGHAVDASPKDGGQSVMPQRCLDKGY